MGYFSVAHLASRALAASLAEIWPCTIFCCWAISSVDITVGDFGQLTQ